VDTNLLAYLYEIDKDEEKREVLKNFFIRLRGWELFISSQVCKELGRVASEKYGLSATKTTEVLRKVRRAFNVLYEDCQDIETAVLLREKYLLQYWDALVIAVALNNRIPVLFTEDDTYPEITFRGRSVRLINPFS